MTAVLPLRARAVRLHWRSRVALVAATAVGLVGFGWPFLLPPGSEVVAHSADAPYLFIVLLALLLAVVLAEVADGGIDVKAIAVLGVLAACGAALRPLGGGVTGFTLVFFLLIPAGRVFGAGFGFVLGALTMFASALLTGGVGPWLPYQMLGAAWVGLGAALLPPARGRAELALLAGYGVVAGLAYGLLLNLWFWPFTIAGTGAAPGLAYVAGDPVLDNLARYGAFFTATSLGYDIPRAVANVVLVLAAGRPVLLALRRAARRAAFDAEVEFR
jgi:energy-coupling factor transport system substrate-specific component